MSKMTGLFAASAAALILACVAGWAVSDTQAPRCRPGDHSDRSLQGDDERNATARPALIETLVPARAITSVVALSASVDSRHTTAPT